MPRRPTIASLLEHIKNLLIEKAEAERALESEQGKRINAEREASRHRGDAEFLKTQCNARVEMSNVHDLVIEALGLDSVDIGSVEMRNQIRKASNYRELSLVLSVINTIRNAGDRAREAAREAEQEKAEANLDALVTNIVKDAAEVAREKGGTKAPSTRYQIFLTSTDPDNRIGAVKTVRNVVEGMTLKGAVDIIDNVAQGRRAFLISVETVDETMRIRREFDTVGASIVVEPIS